MRSLFAELSLPPSAQLRRHHTFYLRYDGVWAVLCVGALAWMTAVGHGPLLAGWGLPVVLLLPLVCYAQILCSVFVHNAVHQSFPRRINRLVGELCGMVILTRFASWEIIHQRHHRYADDPVRDPHPLHGSYFTFLVRTVVNVEVTLQAIFFERYGDTPENRRYERLRARVSYATNLLLVATWYRFCGPVAFFGLFVPAAIVGFLHLVHFNWSTHDAGSPTGTFRPINIDRGLYKIGNRLLFGIYMHANHHARPGLFNPGRFNPGRLGQDARVPS
ncbi:MAG: fatty acid desaturase [Pseudomonadota bacterium]|nr:fatty acid desaturase [Pseudomonadota bacterium]